MQAIKETIFIRGIDMQTKNYITMLGTGNALVTRCYNTCFTLHSMGGALMLVDAGGGNGILTQLERAGYSVRTSQTCLSRMLIPTTFWGVSG